MRSDVARSSQSSRRRSLDLVSSAPVVASMASSPHIVLSRSLARIVKSALSLGADSVEFVQSSGRWLMRFSFQGTMIRTRRTIESVFRTLVTEIKNLGCPNAQAANSTQEIRFESEVDDHRVELTAVLPKDEGDLLTIKIDDRDRDPTQALKNTDRRFWKKH